MNKLLNEYSSEIDCCICELEDAICALRLLDEFFDQEGYQPEDQFENWKAISFAKRFPMYLYTFRTLTNGIARIVSDLKAAQSKADAARMQEKTKG